MKKEQSNIAYIDAANLYNGIVSQKWKLDYKRFRIWLSEKYGVKLAYLFIGLVPKNKNLYTKLQEDGYTLVYKEVIYDGAGKPKGNCDADMVLSATRDYYENKFGKAVIVTSDGDYASLIKFLNDGGKLETVLSPAVEKKCSILIKRTGVPITYLNQVKNRLVARP